MASARTRRLIAVGATVAVLAVVAVIAFLKTRPAGPGPIAQPPAPSGPPKGIVTLTADPAGAGTLLHVHNPLTGALTRTLTLLDDRLTDGDRRLFNADLTRVAWRDPSTIHVAELRGDRYEEIAAWGPERVLDQAEAEYDSLILAPDGRVWVQATLRAGTTRQTKVVSFDPTHPTAAPRAETVAEPPAGFDRRGTPAESATLPVGGEDASTAVVLATAAELLPSDVTITSAGRDDAKLTCPAQLDPTALLCYSSQTPRYGRVVELRLDPATRTLAIREVATNSERPVQGLLLAPDRSEMRLITSTGWNGVRLDGTPTASPAPAHPDRPLAWL